MKEIKFTPICGKSSEILYARPCVFTFGDDYLETRCEFAYSHKTEDEMMPSKDVTVDESSIYLKKHISCVEWAYSSEGEVWFFQFWHHGQNAFCNVKDKEEAQTIARNIAGWLNSK